MRKSLHLQRFFEYCFRYRRQFVDTFSGGWTRVDAVDGTVEQVDRRPEQIAEVGFKPCVAQCRNQGIEDIGDGASDDLALGKRPWIGLVVEGPVAEELQFGKGLGAFGQTLGEVCFNTSMTGYQEILTDPSYAGQIITFTFPHIGNVGTNDQDIEPRLPKSRGLVLREDATAAANWRAQDSMDRWLKDRNLIGIVGVDTRRLVNRIRDHGAPKGCLAFAADGRYDVAQLWRAALQWPGLEGADLTGEVSCLEPYEWTETAWPNESGYSQAPFPDRHVVCVDYGAKRNILRSLAGLGCRVTVVPARSSAASILALRPNGIVLSNGPGDPSAISVFAVPIIRELLTSGLPIFGICLGHQLLALALGARTVKMHLGHRGGNHPVQDLETRRVEITCQNHGFVVERQSLPRELEETHTSLFDGTLEGLRVKNRPAFSVQFHPEASPGPQDSYAVFERFAKLMS